MTPRRILFTTFGSLGDVYPYLAIGRELQQRGHRVTIATSGAHRNKVESTGIRFHAVRPDIEFEDREFLEKAFDQRRGTELILKAICGAVRDSYEDTLPAVRDADLLITHALSYAAVIAAERVQLPWISTMLSPINFLSAYDPPVLAQAPWLSRLKPLGPALFRFFFQVGRSRSWQWAADVVALRRSLGLPKGPHPFFEGAMSPALVLALFSRELAQPQRDWPPNTLVTGFPFFSEGEALPDPVRNFLSAGPPPLVFTLGSAATGAAGTFYRESFDAVQSLGTRAIFLTGHYAQGLPQHIPVSMLTAPYAPHDQLFPRSEAIIHHGGVGTTAQAMRAGKPMLLVPFAHDQYDNAERIRRLGAGAVLPIKSYRSKQAAALLDHLCIGAAHAAKSVAERMQGEDGVGAAADAIERFG